LPATRSEAHLTEAVNSVLIWSAVHAAAARAQPAHIIVAFRRTVLVRIIRLVRSFCALACMDCGVIEVELFQLITKTKTLLFIFLSLFSFGGVVYVDHKDENLFVYYFPKFLLSFGGTKTFWEVSDFSDCRTSPKPSGKSETSPKPSGKFRTRESSVKAGTDFGGTKTFGEVLSGESVPALQNFHFHIPFSIIEVESTVPLSDVLECGLGLVWSTENVAFRFRFANRVNRVQKPKSERSTRTRSKTDCWYKNTFRQ
jgi:hypothetical protein